MTQILGILLAIIFAVLGAFHIFWAMGGRFGIGAAIPTSGGERVLHPTPLVTMLVAIALFGAALIVLGRINIWGAFIPGWVFSLGSWLISLLFLLRAVGDFRYVGFFKGVTGTNFAYWDTILFSPLCLLIAVLAFLISYCGNCR